MSLTVGLFTGDDAEWDTFGRTQPGWTAFHRYAWKNVIARSYGHETHFLSARDDAGKLVGILGLVQVKSHLFGHFLVSMPFVSYGGPLGNDAAIKVLAQHALELSLRTGAKLLELRSLRALPLAWPASHRKITVVLPIAPNDSASTFASLGSKLRSQIRRPSKEGVEFRFGPAQLMPFYEVFSRHMRDLGTPTLGRGWFRVLQEELGDDVWFGCAWFKGIPIAGGVGFRWNDEFEITWASSLRSHNRLSANVGMYWAFIERAAHVGLRRFNFGRCTPGSTTHKFKLQWGAKDEPLYWYQAAQGNIEATPSAGDPRFGLATRLWSRMPLPLANFLGPQIVRFIP